MRVLLSGAGGFVGSHVLRHLLMNTDSTIVAPVTFRHKGLPERIESSICDNPEWVRRVDIPHWDMTTMPSFSVMHAVNDCDVFMNIASESHVDRSIKDPVGFTTNNVQLIQNLIEVAKLVRPEIILQMSTDEVYGPAPEGYAHKEWDPIIPSNPYSASKAMQEAYCIAAWRTFGLPIVITNTMNIIGELQSPEKFVPMIIRNLRDDRPIAVHCAPDGTPGSRFYLHARNLADAWLWLVNRRGENWDLQMYSDGSSRPRNGSDDRQRHGEAPRGHSASDQENRCSFPASWPRSTLCPRRDQDQSCWVVPASGSGRVPEEVGRVDS